jgi:hypothetical protein
MAEIDKEDVVAVLNRIAVREEPEMNRHCWLYSDKS